MSCCAQQPSHGDSLPSNDGGKAFYTLPKPDLALGRACALGMMGEFKIQVVTIFAPNSVNMD